MIEINKKLDTELFNRHWHKQKKDGFEFNELYDVGLHYIIFIWNFLIFTDHV